MNWSNRGKELEALGEGLKDKKNIVFYGLSNQMVGVYRRVSFLQMDIAYCWDKYCGEEIKAISGGGIIGSFADALSLVENKNYLLIIALTDRAEKSAVKKRMILNGYVENVDFMDASSFLDIFLPIYILYAHRKCFLEYINHPVNWKCTLKCKKCASCMPYLKRDNDSLAKLNQETDWLFEKVDFVQQYVLIGGEAFLAQDLLLGQMKYLFNNYNDRFGEIMFISNATVLPKEEILDFMEKNRDRITLYVSYYSNVPGWQEKFERFEKKFLERELSFQTIINENWMNFGFDDNITLDLAPEELTIYFDLCGQYCRRYQDGKLAYCADAYDAQMAFYPEIDQESETLDLRKPDITKTDIVEMFLGYQEKGYIEMCRHCNGWGNRNKNTVPVAEQL